MNNIRKTAIYWTVYLVLLVIGMAISFFRILPVQSTPIFLMGLLWLWTGVSVALNINPTYAKQYVRRYQCLLAVSSAGIGIAWVILACFPAVKQAIPVILVSLPFIFLDFWCFKHKGRNEET